MEEACSVPASSSASSVVPAGFKAAKRRKSLRTIREQSKKRQAEPRLPERRPSDIDPELLDNSDRDELMAAVAKLIFRHIEDPDDAAASPEASTTAGSCSQPGGHADSVADGLQEPGQRPGQRRAVRGVDFNRDLYFVQPSRPWFRRCRARQCLFGRKAEEAMSPEPIFRLLRDIATVGSFCEERETPQALAVLSAIYIERLLEGCPSVRLTSLNWQPIVVASLLLASKVWEDIHPWNMDFSGILNDVAGLHLIKTINLYYLESLFLKAVNWRVAVTAETYGTYYFSLMAAGKPPSPSWRHQPRAEDVIRASSFGPTTSLLTPHAESLGWVSSAPSSDGPLSTESSRDAVLDDADARPELVLIEETAPMDGMMWMDRHNPLIGNFRHAPHAGPPSRYINPRGRCSADSRRTYSFEPRRSEIIEAPEARRSLYTSN
jgi:hypothetical protein